MATPLMRAFLGFVAGALAVLTFHQGMVAALHFAGLLPGVAYRLAPVPPFGVPVIVNLCFWGGLYGLVFGLVSPRLRAPVWVSGIILGLIAATVGMFVVAPIKGTAIANGWAAWPMARSYIINATWGLGVGLILPLLLPRTLRATDAVQYHAS